MRRTTGVVAALAYIATIYGANYAVKHYGVVPVFPWPYLVAPAGVYLVGIAFTLRDYVQVTLGRLAVLVAITVGAAISFQVGGQLALASAVAFGFSELADFAVFTPMVQRGWLRAVAVSNAVGLVVDSLLFLWLAFGSLEFLPGQIVGKAWMTIAAIAITAYWRNQLRAEAQVTA